ncbi:class II fructose-bisphosphate aldolase, partial [Klebsiella pneumoniae]|uniref:class II fructose-bisphosphate aldolase n=1 Tax=Klebsiella pneumoniae TaxID=573 RepID=UPI0027315A7B
TLAPRPGLSGEADLRTIAASEDGIDNSEVIYADPQECYTRVTETQVDCLAAARGATPGRAQGQARRGGPERKASAEPGTGPL